jgi:hypothetical protein
VFYLHPRHGAPIAFFLGGGLAVALSALSYMTVERAARRISTRVKRQTNAIAPELHETKLEVVGTITPGTE